MHKRNKECHTSCHQRQQQKAPDGVKVMKQHETYMLNKSMSPWRQLSAKVAPFHRASPPDKKTTAISFEGQLSHPLDVTKGFKPVCVLVPLPPTMVGGSHTHSKLSFAISQKDIPTLVTTLCHQRKGNLLITTIILK